MRESNKVTIRLDLEGKIADLFDLLKKRRGLKANAELTRQIIVEAMRQEGILKEKEMEVQAV